MKWFLLSVFACAFLIQSCETGPAPIKTNSVSIPFELTEHNNISIKAVLNGKDSLDLMFHTAASDLSLTTAATKNINSITWDEKHDVKSWGGSSTARYSNSNSLQIGSLKWDSLNTWEDEHSGPGTGGKFGPDLFKGKAIEVNFDTHLLTLHDSLPGALEKYSKTPIIFENGMMFIEGTSSINGEDFINKFLIHSGYSGTILYDDKFSAESNISAHIEITDEQELKDSYGNVIKTLKGTLPKFSLAGLPFENVTVGFFEGTIGRQQMSVMGGGLIKQFNFIIDPKKEFIYLTPNQSVG